MYDLRCKVAHNKSFNKQNLDDVAKLAGDLKPILEKAITSLDDIDVSEEEKDTVFESVLSTHHYDLGKFMSRYHRLEIVLKGLVGSLLPDMKFDGKKGLKYYQSILVESGVISVKQYHVITQARVMRNRLVHHEFEMDRIEVFQIQNLVEELIFELEKILGSEQFGTE